MSQYAFWTTLLMDVVIKVSLLLLVVWVGSLFMRKRSAAAQHRWWTLGFVGCLLIPAIGFVTPTWTLPILPEPTEIADPSPVDNIPLASNRAVVDPMPSGLAEQARQRGMPPRQQPTILDESTKAIGGQPIATTKDPADALGTTSITKTLLILWIVGIAICWLRSIWQHVLLRRLLNCCVRLDDPEWIELLTKCSLSLSLRQEVSLLRHKSAHSPVSTGAWHPVVILPEDAESWDVDRRRLVLLHELAHVARRDVLTQTLAGLACGLYWFNPLCWFGLFQMRRFREMACDDLVLSCGQQPSGYADVLLAIARSYRHQSYSTAVGMAHSTNVESRIMAILDKTRRHASLSRTAARRLLASAAALVCLVGSAQLRSQAEPSARATEQEEASVEAAEVTPKQDANEPIRMPIVIAEHLMLFEGREVISWDQLDERIAVLPAGSRVHPEFYFTNGAHRSGRYQQSKDKMWELHGRHHWHGRSEGSLWPSAGVRYDRLKTAADLVPDETRRLDVRVVDQQDRPVADAEVLLMPPNRRIDLVQGTPPNAGRGPRPQSTRVRDDAVE
jgi:beta-lactamase regulating signal transducer with metallopeptidase domain